MTASLDVHRPVTRGCDLLLDGAVAGLATWTVVYHVCFVARVPSTAALLAELVVLAVLGVLAVLRLRSQGSGTSEPAVATSDQVDGRRALPQAIPILAIASAVIAAGAMALRLPWAFVWVAWLVAAAGGLVLAGRTPAAYGGDDISQSPRDAAPWALTLALGAAVFSAVTLRPNPDDLFYVNFSQWVAAHGTFPHRDTIFGDLRYPMANWPPLASYDAGTGALAHLLGLPAGSVVYLVIPPLASALSVLALWRLLRAWRVPLVGLAMTAAVAFLLFDGTSSYGTPGNLWVTRLWQGKVILVCVVVPVLLVWALQYVERPSRAGALRLFVGGVAAVGCSTTGIFLAPVVALAAMAPLVRRAPRRALLGFVALSAYPLGSGAVTLAVGGRSADDFGIRRQYRFDPSWFGHEVFLDGAVAAVGVAAVLMAWRVLPHPAARITSAVAALAVGVTLVPGATRLTYDLVGLGPTLWRLTWVLAVPATVGAGASWVVVRVRPRAAGWGIGALVAVLVGVGGHPVWAAATSTSFAAPWHWQRGEQSRAVTAWAVRETPRGERFLGPDELSVTLAVTTTRVKAVAPRDYYMDYLRDDPTFDYAARLALVRFANGDPGWTAAQVRPALASLDVATVCVADVDRTGIQVLSSDGYRAAAHIGGFRCFLAGT